MISLKLTPGELGAMIQYLRTNLEDQRTLPLAHQTTNMLVLLDYLDTWKAHRLISWSQRAKDKTYKLSMKLPIAKAMHQEMQYTLLRGLQQGVLNKLDHAIINYQNPASVAHVIGDLVR